MEFLNKINPMVLVLGVLSALELIFSGVVTTTFWLWFGYGIYKINY
jgi:hypothetical protein